jgi:hypothetical protein
MLQVTRGSESRKLFIAAAGATLTFLLTVLFQISTYPSDGKVALYLANLILVIYLCFFSSWFTNKLVGLKIAFESRKF